VVGRYSEQFPGVRVSLHIQPLEDVVRDLKAQTLDLAIVTEGGHPLRPVDWECLHLADDHLGLIAGPRHPLGQSPVCRVDELVEHSLILRLEGSSTRQRVFDGLVGLGLSEAELRIAFQLSHTEAIKHAVMAGLGVAWVSRMASAREHAAGWLRHVSIDGWRVSRPIWAFAPPAANRRPLLNDFIEILQAHVRNVEDAWGWKADA
jgi:DNA-binding transcriptional LysR family regulator